MVELLSATLAFTVLGLALWMLVDSDDDNGGGGLMEPTLVPIPVRSTRR